jgi:hypothetical protein
MSNLPEAVANARALSISVWNLVHDKDVPSDTRTRVGAGLINISMSHHSGIVKLYEGQSYASAFALIRPAVDSFLRAEWILHVATDKAINAFVGGDDPPGAFQVIKKLEETGIYDAGLLEGIIRPIWGLVSDFTHGGGKLVVRHLTEDSIGPAFKEDELINVLDAANGWMLVAAAAIAEIRGDDELAGKLMELSQTALRDRQ